MLASIKQHGLHMTITPGFVWDEEQHIFKGSVLYGDETLTLCVTRARMQDRIHQCLEANENIEPLFDPANWVMYAEYLHDPAVYFEDEGELGP
jgi:hypothetical protein